MSLSGDYNHDPVNQCTADISTATRGDLDTLLQRWRFHDGYALAEPLSIALITRPRGLDCLLWVLFFVSSRGPVDMWFSFFKGTLTNLQCNRW